jgi:hypothetical protein
LLGSIGGVLLLAFLLGQILGLPEVEDPIPDRINVDVPFTWAGMGGFLAGLLFSVKPKRERAMRIWGMFGFALGAGLYLLALAVQLVSRL